MENSHKISLTSRRYLGSKTKLLPFIHETLNKEGIVFDSLLDIFGGTGSVANSFNDGKHSIYVNDLLESNRCSYNAFFGSEHIEEKKIDRIIDSFNATDYSEPNYFSINFSDTFFSESNCMKIGGIREDIETLYNASHINQREKDILITSLLYAMDRIANTVGHYDAFRRGGDLSKPLVLKALDLPSESSNKHNRIYRMDANELAKECEADVVYIDPPYNSRQYCDAYHLLENVARWEKPKVYGVAKKMDRGGLKSRYCENSAPRAFNELIMSLRCKFILVSYNNMGVKGAGRSQAKISDIDIVRSLEQRGKVVVYETNFNQFTTGKTHISDHKERLFVCRVGEFDKTDDISVPAYVKSPLNYTGGKFKLLKQICELFPSSEHHTFIDLFGGGFNVGANSWCQEVVYNDISKQTMRVVKLFYKYSPTAIIGKLDELIAQYGLSDSEKHGYEYYGCTSDKGLGAYNKAGFVKAKQDYNSLSVGAQKDFLLLLLIIFSFNNQIRFNGKGEFNLPVGKRDLNPMMRKHIKEFAEKLKTKHVSFVSKTFTLISPRDYDDPFFYCDPPYLLGDASYNESGGWDTEKETALLTYLSNLSALGIKFALSNVIEHKGKKHQALIDWALNGHYSIHYLNKNYSNSNYQIKDKGQTTVEVLITNY